MWSINLKLAVRNLFKNKLQSFILIGGLVVGMTACILLLQYVGFETSYDQFHTKKDDIYRVINERFQQGNSIQKGAITYPLIGQTMKDEFPEVKNYTRIAYSSDVIVKRGEQISNVEPMLWVDQHFLEIFDFPLLSQEGIDLLDEPNEAIINRRTAEQFFPGVKDNFAAIVGEEIQFDNYPDPFRIVAVCEDHPTNSSLQFEVLLSFASAIRYWNDGVDESWTWSDFYHYLELEPGTDPQSLEAKFAAFSERHFRGTEVSGSEEVFTLQALSDSHLYSSDLEYEIIRTANGRAVWSLLIIAFFILFIAWINYVNLSSVRAIERSKEVGVRKVIGATRVQLMRQFLSEALIVNMISLLIALLLVQLAQPWFASTFGLEARSLQFFSGTTMSYYLILGLAILIGGGVFLSGAYPAWLLSSTQISSVLKGIFSKASGGAWLRKGLVITQFTLSIGLITATWLVSKQIAYMNKKDLGIDVSQVLTINSPELSNWDSNFIDRLNVFKNELVRLPGVESATASSRTPGNRMARIFQIRPVGAGADVPSVTSNLINVDHSYAETYGMEMLEGRFFRRSDHSHDFDDVNTVVINESAVQLLGFTSNTMAIDQEVNFWNKNWRIVGVFPDFHQVSLHAAIEPIFFLPLHSTYNPISLRLSGDQLGNTINEIKGVYAKFFPGNIFTYSFVDDYFQNLYEADLRFGKVLTYFTFLTTLIACLGLFGLASYMTFLRTKEIGIRKVLGASVWSIVTLLSREFLQLVFIAILLAAPMAYWMVDRWLTDFAYRIDIPWWVFLLSGLAAILLAILTVSLQSIRAATINPSNSLKNE